MSEGEPRQIRCGEISIKIEARVVSRIVAERFQVEIIVRIHIAMGEF